MQFTHSTAFISIMDAYHAPYNRKHRYWTGLMLLTRCVLFLAFVTNYSSDPVVINSYITALVIFGIFLVNFFAKVYRHFLNNLLEISFLCNLEILSITLCYLQGTSLGSDSVICKSMSASISTSFIVFIGIVSYHAHLQIQGTKWYKSVSQVILRKLPVRQHEAPISLEQAPMTTLLELREELLASSHE